MKWFLFLCMAFSLFSQELDDNPEIAAFDPTVIVQQPITPQEIELPPPPIDLPRKNSFLAVSLSTLVPGFGHLYLGDMKTASGLIGSTGLGIGLVVYPNLNDSIRFSSITAVQSIWSYGIYAAYRDVRTYNREFGYSYKMPTDSFADLTLAPFNPRVLKKPEVWGGFLGAFAVATVTAYLVYPKEAHIHTALSSKMELSPIVALPIGIGEECLFRGYLQSQLSEVFTPWGGIALSSLAFGAMHIPNALLLEPEDRRRYYTFSLPFITALGGYFGWLTHKNRSLKESVAIHTWYDFVLFAASAYASRAAIGGRSEFAIAIPF